ncbi:MAG: H/ACA ribonucleoprotein complex subunit 4 [Patescibacteria group bacterium]|jgi:H/ACA ribonucleoprotein complex subunit 4
MKETKDAIKFGIINIDKPTGPTSFSVSNLVRRKLNLNKTSHLGTLDPKVTGVLPIALGRGCKLAGYFMGSNKTYVGILHTHKEQDIKELQELINKNFTGKIQQTPPHKSAVKRAERTREVFSWNLTEEGEDKKDFVFTCEVEGGTYIRKLCSDLGELIGGAHMAELRRTQAGIFSEEKIVTLYEFEEALKEYQENKPEKLKAMIIPAEKAIEKVLPKIQVEKRVKKVLLTGKPLYENDIINKEEFAKVKIDDAFLVYIDKEFIEVAKKVSNHEMVARSEFVYN